MELYLHIPFCVRKCLYCDFLSFPVDGETRQKYVDKLAEEIRSCGKRLRSEENRIVTSVFIGGGTPSLLTVEQIHTVMSSVRESFALAPDAEITIEANPGAFDEARVRSWKKEGINRLSLGLQSSKREELQCLGRIHSFEDFLDSFRLAREGGFDNINVDLMSALPGQTVESFQETLKKVTELNPEHISAYSLILEEGTPFYQWYGENAEEDTEKLKDAGEDEMEEGTCTGRMPRLPIPDEDTDRQMYHETKEYLEERGYNRYEISNYARPGWECRHNIGYWNGTDYLGFGIGAASLMNGERFAVTTSLDAYLDYSAEELEQGLQYRNPEVLTENERMEEFMFLGLRLTEGVAAADFKERFGRELESVYWEPLSKLEEEGLLTMYGAEEERKFRLTEYGLDVSNYALAEFLLQ